MTKGATMLMRVCVCEKCNYEGASSGWRGGGLSLLAGFQGDDAGTASLADRIASRLPSSFHSHKTLLRPIVHHHHPQALYLDLTSCGGVYISAAEIYNDARFDHWSAATVPTQRWEFSHRRTRTSWESWPLRRCRIRCKSQLWTRLTKQSRSVPEPEAEACRS